MASRAFVVHRGCQATIGFLGATTPSAWSAFVTAFEQRLRARHWINGGNVNIDYRWANGRQDAYRELAKDFADRGVDVIVTSGTAPVLAAQEAAPDIPIVFASAGEGPSLRRGNVTGLANRQAGLAGERVRRFREAIPDLQALAVIGNVSAPNVEAEMKSIGSLAAALTRGLQITEVPIVKAEDILPAIESVEAKKDNATGLYVCTDPLVTAHAVRINTLAISRKLPTMHAFREYVLAGGLMSYGPDFRMMFERAADLVDNLLRGTELDKLQTDEDFAPIHSVNLTTARALGLDAADRLTKPANEVIE
jgi:putative tryptophan/tyrosine transport system substrate-binding protein